MTSASQSHPGLPATVKPFDLLNMVSKLRQQLGLRDQDVAYLRHIFTQVRTEDFLPDRICSVWAGAGTLACALGFNPRQIARIEARLEKCGLIWRTWRKNGKRYGARGRDGRIAYAGGINLAPLIERASQLREMSHEQQNAFHSLQAIRSQVTGLIGSIRALNDEEALEAARSAFPRLRPSEVTQPHRLEQIIQALEAVLSDFTPQPGRTVEVAVSDSSGRPNTRDDKNIKNCTEPASTTPLPRTTPEQALALASEDFRSVIHFYADSLGNRSMATTWPCLCLAAAEFAQIKGIVRRDWDSSCAQIGEEKAVLALVIAERNSSREGPWQVRNVAGAFRGIVHKEKIGRAILTNLVGELLRHIRCRGAV